MPYSLNKCNQSLRLYNKSKHELHLCDTLHGHRGTPIFPTQTENFPSITSVYTEVTKLTEMAIKENSSVF